MRPPIHLLGVGAVLAVAVWAVFGQTRHFEFVNYDDNVYIYENPLVAAGLSPEGVAEALSYVHAFTWHPLTTVSHMADAEIHGLDPGGHHLSNVLLHAAAAIVLFLVLRGMTGALWRSAFVALIFAVHPLRVESVAWISERKDVLSGLLFFLTLGAWARYAADARVGRYLVALGCFALALMAKPTVVTLPCVLLLLDVWPLKRLGEGDAPWRHLRARVVEKIPFFVLSAACGVITLRTQTGAMTSTEVLPFWDRLGNALVSYVVYVRQLFWPPDLAVVYPHPKDGLPWWTVGLAAVALAAVTVAAVVLRWRMPFLLVGWLWYLGMLLPVIGLVQVGLQAHADRYTYLPHVGLLLMLAWGAAEAWPHRLDRRWLAAAAGVAGLVLVGLARAQTAYWRDSESLWRMTLARTTNNSVAHSQLGVVLGRTGRTSEAVEHFRRAIAIQPDYATARYNLGNILANRGNFGPAIEQYRWAVQIKPDYAKAHNNLGSALRAQGRLTDAVAAFRQALEIDPHYLEAHLNLAATLAAAGELAAAADEYRLALRDQPGSAAIHNNLGSVQLRQGRSDEAVEQYREALRLEPDYAAAHYNLGLALVGRGDLDGAIEHFRRSLEIEPEAPRTHAMLAMALAQQGDRKGAVEHYRRALELAAAAGDQRLVEQIRSRLGQ